MKKFITYISLSILIHLLILWLSLLYYPSLKLDNEFAIAKKMTVHHRPTPPKPPEPEPIPEPDNGQIVELPEPVVEERPDKADYLAEHSHKVDEETKTDRYRINPDVIADQYSSEDQIQFEEAIDVNATEPSSGATVGNNTFKLSKQGSKFALPSPYAITNKDGLEKPTLASSTSENLTGSPNNDLIDEKRSDRIRLNAHSYKYASYMNQIRRLVNFYWNQNLDNLHNTTLYKSKYTTVVHVQITSNGELHSIEVSHESGDSLVDECVTKAFELAAPFPEPPKLLIQNGLVELPDFSFELQVGTGESKYKGIDPRAGVRFPGILKAPR
jgi:outer membrane biosynthesis protein TonB